MPLTQSEQFQQFCAPTGPFLSCLALVRINKVLIYCSSHFSLLQVNLPLLIKLLSTPMLGYNRINGTLRQYLHSLYCCGIQITQFSINFDLYLFYEHFLSFSDFKTIKRPVGHVTKADIVVGLWGLAKAYWCGRNTGWNTGKL